MMASITLSITAFLQCPQPNNMILKQVTLWLIPPPSVAEKLQANIIDLSNEYDGSAPFVPHVTVVGGIPCSSGKELEEITKRLKQNLAESGEIPCRFRDQVETMYNKNDSTLVWNQACVSVMERGEEFMAIHKLTRKILGMDDENWEFPAPLREPHLSHFYGTKVPPSLDDVLAAPDFVAHEAALWETSGGYEGVKNWRELARIKLS